MTVDEVPPEWQAAKAKLKALYQDQPWFVGIGFTGAGLILLIAADKDPIVLDREIDGISVFWELMEPEFFHVSPKIVSRMPTEVVGYWERTPLWYFRRWLKRLFGGVVTWLSGTKQGTQ